MVWYVNNNSENVGFRVKKFLVFIFFCYILILRLWASDGGLSSFSFFI